jgi:hypothetical protein
VHSGVGIIERHRRERVLEANNVRTKSLQTRLTNGFLGIPFLSKETIGAPAQFSPAELEAISATGCAGYRTSCLAHLLARSELSRFRLQSGSRCDSCTARVGRHWEGRRLWA